MITPFFLYPFSFIPFVSSAMTSFIYTFYLIIIIIKSPEVRSVPYSGNEELYFQCCLIIGGATGPDGVAILGGCCLGKPCCGCGTLGP